MRSILFISILIITFFTNAQVKIDSLSIEEFTYDQKNELKIYGVRPLDYNPNKEYPAIVIFHGGGWSMGEASWGFSSAKHYASKGMIAFSVQYRLQESDNEITPYESVLDAQNAIRWVRKNARKLSINANMIASYGWSAGAHLAACAAIFNNLNVPDERISSSPNLLLLKSPALSLLLYSNFQNRLQDKIDVKEISPAEFISENTPPTIIVIGRDDTVTPLEGSELFKNNMDKHHNQCELVVYDGVGHLFTPSSEPDDGWPSPDEKVRIDAQIKMDNFLIKHNYIKI
jgi:acetyl esterase/lipase